MGKHCFMENKASSLLFLCAFFICQFSFGDMISNHTDGQQRKTISNKIAEVAIIIDDLGYNKENGLAMINLPGALTYAVIPHSPNAVFLAKFANSKHKEIMLHAPMSNISDFPMGDIGLNESMEEDEFNHALIKAINSVPHIRGVNNHMGSLLTQKHLPMEWTMQRLSERGLYFIDSRTTSQSIAWRTAQISNVPSLKRDVFLDNERDPQSIDHQFMLLIQKAKRKGYAIAIAHPYPETINYLKQNLGKLAASGIELVPASTLVHRHSPNLKRIQAKAQQ